MDKFTLMTAEEVVYWCFNNHLLIGSRCCEVCRRPMTLKKSLRTKDVLVWRCLNYLCSCYTFHFSIRDGSVFEKWTTDLRIILKAIYMWTTGMQAVDIIKHVKISESGFLKLRSLLHSKILLFFEKSPISLGGPGKIVQVDETMLNHKVKAHRGRAPREQVWALGIVDCSYKPAKGFMCLIENKSAEVIMPIIKKHVREGSIIYTDEAKVYMKLGECPGFKHKSIIHKYKFVDYEAKVHTQNIESFNNKVKLRIKMMKGIKNNQRKNFLLEFNWLQDKTEDLFLKTLKLFQIN